jgi:hypothetical protein
VEVIDAAAVMVLEGQLTEDPSIPCDIAIDLLQTYNMRAPKQ